MQSEGWLRPRGIVWLDLQPEQTADVLQDLNANNTHNELWWWAVQWSAFANDVPAADGLEKKVENPK